MADIFSVKVVNSDEYAIEDEFCAVMEKLDHSFPKGAEKKQFEQEIIVPIFRYAKHVKIYDRYVGRSILQKNNAKKYKSMLKSILNVFGTTNSRQGIFEVYCGFKPPNSSKLSDALSDAKTKLKQLEADLQNLYPRFKLIVKDETKGKEFIHDRFMITDQFALSMGRGVGLLSNKEGWLRDFTIAYCSEPDKIDADVRRLPDL